MQFANPLRLGDFLGITVAGGRRRIVVSVEKVDPNGNHFFVWEPPAGKQWLLEFMGSFEDYFWDVWFAPAGFTDVSSNPGTGSIGFGDLAPQHFRYEFNDGHPSTQTSPANPPPSYKWIQPALFLDKGEAIYATGVSTTKLGIVQVIEQ